MLQHTSSKIPASRLMTAGLAAVALLALAPVEIVAQRPPAPPHCRRCQRLRRRRPRALAPCRPHRLPGSGCSSTAGTARAAGTSGTRGARRLRQSRLPCRRTAAASAPSSDEVVLRLKSPATEQEAVDTALRVLETQLAQIDEQAAATVRLTVDDRTELAQVRRKLEELMQMVQSQETGRPERPAAIDDADAADGGAEPPARRSWCSSSRRCSGRSPRPTRRSSG